MVRRKENSTFDRNAVAKFWRKKGTEYSPKNTIPNSKIWRGNNHDLGLHDQGIGNIEIIEGRMNGAYYRNILKRNLRQSVHSLGLKPSWVFQQDNDPNHTSKLTNSWLSSNRIDVLKWPNQSPDFNPIENLCTKITLRIQRRNLQSLHELKQSCREELKNIIQETCKNFIGDYSKRLHAVISNNGYVTKY